MDARLIAATNRDLTKRIKEGRFREDLFYRLNVLRFEMPSLRDRGEEDILLLAHYFLELSTNANAKRVIGFSDRACRLIKSHDWPGNVRELQSAVESGVVMCRPATIDVGDLPPLAAAKKSLDMPGASMKNIELDAIRRTYLATGSTRKTSEVLGLSLRTIQKRMHELGLAKGRGRPPKK